MSDVPDSRSTHPTIERLIRERDDALAQVLREQESVAQASLAVAEARAEVERLKRHVPGGCRMLSLALGIGRAEEQPGDCECKLCNAERARDEAQKALSEAQRQFQPLLRQVELLVRERDEAKAELERLESKLRRLR